MSGSITVLFVCTGNICRSVLAEHYFRQLIGNKSNIKVVSAGLQTIQGIPPSEETVAVLNDLGINASSYRSKLITLSMVEESSHIFVMTQLHKEIMVDMYPSASPKIDLLTTHYQGRYKSLVEKGIPDPINQTKEFYVKVFEIIKDSLNEIYRQIQANKLSI